MSELKPCPFCGDIPTIRGVKHQWLENMLFGEKNEPTEECWWVSCETEGCPAYHMMEYDSKEKAINTWNIRTPQTTTTVHQHGENCTNITNCGTLTVF